MATDLSTAASFPITAQETIGTSYVLLTIPKDAERVDVYLDGQAGSFSYESGAPAHDCPIPSSTWFILWTRPTRSQTRDTTVQVKTALAGTVVTYRVS